jgi:hypothetical protein
MRHRQFAVVFSVLIAFVLVGVSLIFPIDYANASRAKDVAEKDVAEVIATRRMVIVDSNNVTRIELCTTPTTNDPMISIKGADGNSQSVLLADSEGVTLTLGSSDSDARMIVRVYESGEARLFLMRKAGGLHSYDIHLSVEMSKTGELKMFAKGPSDEGYSINIGGQGASSVFGDLTLKGSGILSVVDTATGQATVDIVGQNGAVLKRIP